MKCCGKKASKDGSLCSKAVEFDIYSHLEVFFTQRLKREVKVSEIQLEIAIRAITLFLQRLASSKSALKKG